MRYDWERRRGNWSAQGANHAQVTPRVNASQGDDTAEEQEPIDYGKSEDDGVCEPHTDFEWSDSSPDVGCLEQYKQMT